MVTLINVMGLFLIKKNVTQQKVRFICVIAKTALVKITLLKMSERRKILEKFY